MAAINLPAMSLKSIVVVKLVGWLVRWQLSTILQESSLSLNQKYPCIRKTKGLYKPDKTKAHIVPHKSKVHGPKILTISQKSAMSSIRIFQKLFWCTRACQRRLTVFWARHNCQQWSKPVSAAGSYPSLLERPRPRHFELRSRSWWWLDFEIFDLQYNGKSLNKSLRKKFGFPPSHGVFQKKFVSSGIQGESEHATKVTHENERIANAEKHSAMLWLGTSTAMKWLERPTRIYSAHSLV